MKFTINKNTLQEKLQSATTIAARDSIRDAADYLYFEINNTLTISATDNQLYIKQTNIPIETTQKESTECLIHAQMLSNIVRYSNAQQLIFDVQENHVDIYEDNSQSEITLELKKLHTLPVYPDFDQEYESFPTEQMKAVTSALSHFHAKQDAERALNGLFFFDDRAIAMDRNAGMYVKDLNHVFEYSLVFSPDVAKLVKQFQNETVGIYYDTEFQKVLFQDGDDYYGVILINYEFPQDVVEKIIQQCYNNYIGEITFDITALKTALQRTQVFQDSDDHDLAQITIQDDTVFFKKEKLLGGDQSAIEVPFIDKTLFDFQCKMHINDILSFTKVSVDETLTFHFHKEQMKVVMIETLLDQEIPVLGFLSFNEVK